MEDSRANRMTVAEAERLMPHSEYIRCYRNLCRETGMAFDANMPYGDLPGLFARKALAVGLATAFADIVMGTDMWSVTPDTVKNAVRKTNKEK